MARWLETDPPSPEPFRQVAGWLDRVADAGFAWMEVCRQAREAAATLAEGSAGDWRGPNGDRFRSEVARCASEIAGVEPTAPDGFRAMRELAGVARELAGAIDRVNGDHRNRLQAAAGMVDEWVQRGWTNVQDVVGLESDADAEATRRAIDERNRERERYESELQVLRDRWIRECEGVAAAVQRATQAYELRVVPGPALSRLVEASYHEEAATEYLQRRWARTMVEPFLVEHAGDEPALRVFWDGLSRKEQWVLMERRPDLVKRLWPVLSVVDRREFDRLNRRAVHEEVLDAKAGSTVPVPIGPIGFDIHVGHTIVLRVTHNSDRSVDVYVALQRDGGLEFGLPGDVVTLGTGSQGRVGVVVKFNSAEQYVAARSRLEEAVQADQSNPSSGMASTRKVLAEDFFGAEKGFEVAGGATDLLKAELGQGWLPFVSSATRVTGAYRDSSEQETGVFITGEVAGRAMALDAKLNLDGRLYVTDDVRAYARLTLTGDASVSAALLERSGLTAVQLQHLGLGDGAKGTVAITIKTEATPANRENLDRLLANLSDGWADPEDLLALQAGSEIRVSAATGSARREAIPTNPYVEAEINVTSSIIERSYRKLPDGRYYDEASR